MASKKSKVDDLVGQVQSLLENNPSLNYLSEVAGRDHRIQNPDTFANAIGSILLGSDAPNSLAELLATYFQSNGVTTERNDMFYQYLLQLISTSDQRKFDLEQLKDSRIYNNPLNELSRLTGAGVGRDAAIQLLSGGAAAGSGSSAIGSGSGSSAPGVPAVSGTSDVQRANIAFSAFDCLQSMISMGMQIPQAIAQTKMLQNQAYMSQVETQSFKSVQEVTQQLQNMVTQGILEPADFDSWQNAEDVYKWLNDHLETNAVKPLVDSGALSTTFGTRQGRSMFNDYFHQLKDSQNYGRQYEQFLNENDLKNSLLGLDTQAKRQQFWIDFEMALNDLAQQDQEIQNLIQAYKNGEIQISINGELLEQSKEATKQARYTTSIYSNEAYSSNVNRKLFQSFVEGSEPDEPGFESTGFDLMDYNLWSDFYRQCQYNLADFSRKPYDYVDTKYKIGDTRRHRNIFPREQFQNFLRTNAHVAYTGSLVSNIITSGRLNGFTGNKQPLYQFFDIWKYCGANDFVQTTAGAASDVGLMLLPGPKLKPNF